MKADIYIEVKFKTTVEGGRKTSITGDYYACPLIVDGKAYDCRLLIQGMTLELGQSYKVPVIFLNRDSVLPNLKVGKNIVLWEGKEIANGQIVSVCE